MMKIKQKMAVAITKYSDDPVLVSPSIESDDYWTVLGEVEIEADFDMPRQAGINVLRVIGLRKELTKVKADFQVKKERIEEEIQSLMALEVIYE